MPRPCQARHPELSPTCPTCALYAASPSVRVKWGGSREPIEGYEPAVKVRPQKERAPPSPRPTRRSLAPVRAGRCVHLGAATGEERACRACAERGMTASLHHCAVHTLCTIERGVAGVALCRACPDYQSRMAPPPQAPYAPPRSLVSRLDHTTAWPGFPGRRFNASILRHEDGYLFAYRHGWEDCQIYLGRLDAELNPVGEPWPLDLSHPVEATLGREDPRVFLYQRQIHVSFTGFKGHDRRGRLQTSVLYARLGPDLRVAEVHYPHYPGRAVPMEKNWAFFEHDGGLCCVYSIRPHRVLRVEGDRAELAHESLGKIPWWGGEPHGGTPPVRVGDEFWHFFHDRTGAHDPHYYRMGVYAFEARPPFRVTRCSPEPILVADRATNRGPERNYIAVLFPAGAVREENGWLVSAGVHDRWTEFHRFSDETLAGQMIQVS